MKLADVDHIDALMLPPFHALLALDPPQAQLIALQLQLVTSLLPVRPGMQNE